MKLICLKLQVRLLNITIRREGRGICIFSHGPRKHNFREEEAMFHIKNDSMMFIYNINLIFLIKTNHTILNKIFFHMKCASLLRIKFHFSTSKGSNLYILFAITTAGVVPCGGFKRSPRISSIVQIIYLFRSFEISKDNQLFKTLAFRNIFLSNCNVQPRHATESPFGGIASSSTKGGLLRYIPNTYSIHKVSSLKFAYCKHPIRR